MKRPLQAALFACALLAAPAATQHQHGTAAAAADTVPLYDNLGTHHYACTPGTRLLTA